MQAFTDLFPRRSNLNELVQWAGLFGLAAIIFSETGLLVGVFLPGDSLLVTAGLIAARGYLSIYTLVPVLTAAAICGNSAGYLIGRTTGPRIFSRENSLFFNKKHAMRAHEFYEKHGRKTIVLAQFMPILRTFWPVLGSQILRVVSPEPLIIFPLSNMPRQNTLSVCPIRFWRI